MTFSDKLAVAGLTVACLSLVVALLQWLVKPDRAATFWKQRGRFASSVILLFLIAGLWHFGWLHWLQHRWSIPVWAELLIVVVSAFLPIGLLWVNARVSSVPPPPPNPYFDFQETRWMIQSGEVIEPPLCRHCLVEMLKIPYRTAIEEWRCRQCGITFNWNSSEKGEVTGHVAALYNGERRRRQEALR